MTRRHPYDEPTDREVAAWPGVTVEREQRAKHMALVLTFRAKVVRVIYSLTPSDGARGLENHIATLRRYLSRLGAVRWRRKPLPLAPRSLRKAKTVPKRIRWPEPPKVDPTRDCWAVLAGLRDRLAREMGGDALEDGHTLGVALTDQGGGFIQHAGIDPVVVPFPDGLGDALHEPQADAHGLGERALPVIAVEDAPDVGEKFG